MTRAEATDAVGWQLRRATIDDAEAIAEFHTACWQDAYRGIVSDAVLDGLDVADRAGRWRSRLGASQRMTAVATRGGTDFQIVQIGGLVVWGPAHDPPETDVPELEVASLYVDRSAWGTGLAATLLDHAIGDAPAHLWVFDANARARAFYERHGFSADGRAKIDPGTGVLERRYVRR